MANFIEVGTGTDKNGTEILIINVDYILTVQPDAEGRTTVEVGGRTDGEEIVSINMSFNDFRAALILAGADIRRVTKLPKGDIA